MGAQPFTIRLSRAVRFRLFLVLSSINVLFTCSTALFIYLWARREELSASVVTFTKYWLVQGHLATENVVAAWYSAMLLLTVAAVSLLAWAADRRIQAGAMRHGWLLIAGVFALLSLDEIGSFHERVGMLRLGSAAARGWFYVLALPILAVGMFMLAFAWRHLRQVPAAFGWMAAGIAMFLMNPVLERIEMAMIHGPDGRQGTWQRTLHDVLLVVEEGGLELFGILCFFAAICLYVAARAGAVSEWVVEGRSLRRGVRGLTLTLALGVFASRWLVARLPAGDTGIPENWFPATAWMLVVFAVLVRGRAVTRGDRPIAAVALIVSATFGAGLYGYLDWLTSRASWTTPVLGVVAAGLALELLLSSYRFRFSPMSSIASPTFRRPRPNPS